MVSVTTTACGCGGVLHDDVPRRRENDTPAQSPVVIPSGIRNHSRRTFTWGGTVLGLKTWESDFSGLSKACRPAGSAHFTPRHGRP
jgi:hypothetical protein